MVIEGLKKNLWGKLNEEILDTDTLYGYNFNVNNFKGDYNEKCNSLYK